AGARRRFSRSPIFIPTSITPIRCVIRACTQLCRTAVSFFKPARGSTTFSWGSRIKEGGIATFWLPINQLKVDEAKAILRAFHNVFSNASVWASADQEWIMMGIKGSGRKVEEEEIRQLWSNSNSGADLRRIGIEVPQQMGALFVMDGAEIDLITRDIAPLTD